MFVLPMTASGCFNTQPPEGGWETMISAWYRWISFNTQPPEGGWTGTGVGGFGCLGVSTHSRLKAAGACLL